MQNPRFIESLENRRLLSISAASLLELTTGAQWTDETLQGGKVISTTTDKVKGKATFNKISGTEVDGTVKSATGTSTTKDYYGFDKSKNAVAFGHISISSFAGVTTTATDTYVPDSMVFPATMTAGKTYKSSWTVDNKTVKSPGSTTSFVETVKFSVKLTSNTTTSVSVVAGKYKAYLIDETIATTIGGKTTNGSLQLWAVPNVGLVKVIVGTGKSAITTELTKFKA